MRRKLLGPVVICLFVLAFATTGEAREKSRWDFNVYLDQKRIGEHSFEVTSDAGVTQVLSEANFKYTILLIPAYRYEHTAAERWADNCLVGLDARTNANGDRIQVSGERTGGSFTVLTDEEPAYLPECVMSFAYWNPDFLEQPRLLNPQTGEYVAVQVEEVGFDVLEIRGEPVNARRVRLTAYEVDLTLWYSDDNEWLGLESVAEGGRIIRYELS
ncbi:MAG: DUF6134 family protein [Woeseiaceae bacterium]|nr:DUF6134 family protein [Woeseiaceae bacterium]